MLCVWGCRIGTRYLGARGALAPQVIASRRPSSTNAIAGSRPSRGFRRWLQVAERLPTRTSIIRTCPPKRNVTPRAIDTVVRTPPTPIADAPFSNGTLRRFTALLLVPRVVVTAPLSSSIDASVPATVAGRENSRFSNGARSSRHTSSPGPGKNGAAPSS